VARQRFIHPEIWSDPDLGKLTPIHRLFFIGCFSNADDEGRLLGHPAYLRSTIFPYDDISLDEVKTIRDSVTQVCKNLVCYEVDGTEYLAFLKWSDYQKPKYPKPSKLPKPPTDNDSKNGETFPQDFPKKEESLPNDSPMGRVGMGRDGLGEIPENIPEKESPVPYSEIVEAYHEECPDLPRVLKITTARKKHIKARYREYNNDLSVFRELFRKAGTSLFLNGENNRGWKANFDWLINEQNMAKVLEGKYNDRGPPAREPSPRNNLPVVSFE